MECTVQGKDLRSSRGEDEYHLAVAGLGAFLKLPTYRSESGTRGSRRTCLSRHVSAGSTWTAVHSTTTIAARPAAAETGRTWSARAAATPPTAPSEQDPVNVPKGPPSDVGACAPATAPSAAGASHHVGAAIASHARVARAAHSPVAPSATDFTARIAACLTQAANVDLQLLSGADVEGGNHARPEAAVASRPTRSLIGSCPIAAPASLSATDDRRDRAGDRGSERIAPWLVEHLSAAAVEAASVPELPTSIAAGTAVANVIA